MYLQYSIYQPGKVVNPARGQLNRENEYFPAPVRAWKFGLARQVRPSRPAPARFFSILRLNTVLTYGIPPDFRDGLHFFIPSTAIVSVPSLSGHEIAYRRRSLPIDRRHRANSPQGTIVPVTSSAAFAGITMDHFLCDSLFPHPLQVGVCIMVTYAGTFNMPTTHQ